MILLKELRMLFPHYRSIRISSFVLWESSSSSSLHGGYNKSGHGCKERVAQEWYLETFMSKTVVQREGQGMRMIGSGPIQRDGALRWLVNPFPPAMGSHTEATETLRNPKPDQFVLKKPESFRGCCCLMLMSCINEMIDGNMYTKLQYASAKFFIAGQNNFQIT